MKPAFAVGADLLEVRDRLRENGRGVTVSVPGKAEENGGPASAYVLGQSALLDAMASVKGGRLGCLSADLFLDIVATLVVRVWARWMKRFSNSSVPYLLENFIRRPGRIRVHGADVEIELARRPLDVILEMAGYTADYEQASWLGARRITYRLTG